MIGYREKDYTEKQAEFSDSHHILVNLTTHRNNDSIFNHWISGFNQMLVYLTNAGRMSLSWFYLQGAKGARCKKKEPKPEGLESGTWIKIECQGQNQDDGYGDCCGSTFRIHV